ncbi:hypothetical protein ABPG74_013818 [Tetrahymena malaccensis]
MADNSDKYVLLAGSISSIFFGLGYYQYKVQKKIKMQENQLKNQRIYTPDELKNIIDKNEPLVHKLFSPKDQGNILYGKNLLVQGQINNSDCLKSNLDIESNTQLVARINYDFPYYNDEENYKIISEKTNDSLYYLQKKEQGINQSIKIQPTINLEKKDTICKVSMHENFQNIDKQCYDYTYSKMVAENPSLLKYTWNFFGNIFASIAGIFYGNAFKSYICFKIKVDNCEIGIKNKGIISVLGDVYYNKDKGEFTIPRPLRLMKNKLEYLQMLRDQIESKDKLIFIFFLSSFIFTSISLRQLYISLQQKDYITVFGRRFKVPMLIVNCMRNIRTYFNQNNANSKIGNLKVDVQDEQNNKALDIVYEQPREQMECIICYQRSRSVIIRPCLHCSMCQQCYNVLPKKECPVCKTNIKSELKIFQQSNPQINNNANSNVNNRNLNKK